MSVCGHLVRVADSLLTSNMPNTWRICLAEDNEDDVFIFERNLRHRPCNLSKFEDGEKLREHILVAEPLPHLIILDLKLPRFDGFQFLEWRREEAKARLVPVVVLSSSAEPKDIFRAYDLGVQSYFQKPSGVKDYAEMLTSLEHYWFQSRNFLPARFFRPAV